MEFSWKKLSGVFLFWSGVLIFLNSLTGITGFVVYENVSKIQNSFFGVLFIAIGIFVFIVAERETKESSLVGKVKIVETNHFQRAAKRHRKEAERLIKKIGTGKGHEHKLKGKRGYSIYGPSGDRLVFDYDQSHTTAELLDYIVDHKYRN